MYKLFALFLLTTSVAAHGHIANFIIDSVSWPGFDPTKDPYNPKPPTVAGWTTGALDNGFVDKSSYATPDIVCHKNAANAKGHAVVAAGDKVFLPWDQWPDSHRGPVLDYLAPCGPAGCETVDKTTLKFFKIDEVGRVSAAPQLPGVWASDQLIKNGNGWMVQIPPAIAPGAYVLRHEVIALHATGDPQNYPQCFNLVVTGGGTDRPDGVMGTQLYRATDPGLTFNVYTDKGEYKIPGPPMYKGGVVLQQGRATATSTRPAEVGGGRTAAVVDAGGVGAGAADTAPGNGTDGNATETNVTDTNATETNATDTITITTDPNAPAAGTDTNTVPSPDANTTAITPDSNTTATDSNATAIGTDTNTTNTNPAEAAPEAAPADASPADPAAGGAAPAVQARWFPRGVWRV